MKVSTQKTALELFAIYARQHQRVTWSPVGFREMPGSKGLTKFAIVPNTKAEYSARDLPYVDVKVAKLPFTFTYNFASGKDPLEQLFAAAWKVIRGKILSRHTFHVRPQIGAIEKDFKRLVEGCVGGDIPLEFFYDGPLLPGLKMPLTMTAKNWNFFIPADSKGGQVIKAALEREMEVYRAERLARAKQRVTHSDHRSGVH